MLLHRAFESACQRLPDTTAVVCDDERVTYAGLAQRVASLASLLQSRGVGAGDRVVLYLESSIEFCAAVHAVLAIGAVFVPVSPLTRTDKLAYLLDDTRACALLTDARLAQTWRAALQRSPGVATCVVAGLASAGGAELPWPGATGDAAPRIEPSSASAEDLAAIIYTSGTTGVPKGVMLSHLNMCSAWNSVQSYLGLREGDVIGLALSPAFSYGLYHVLMGLGLGATLVLERAAAFPIRIVERLESERVTVFPGVPTLFSAILGLEGLSRYDLSALRIVTNAAAALPVHHLLRLRELLPQASLFSMYGMTECKRISYLPPEQAALRPASVGRGMPGQEHWLEDDQGRRLPDGATGELVVRGPHVMLGYWDKPAETAERLKPAPDGGGLALHTGDIFRTDADGWLYFIARGDDFQRPQPGHRGDRTHQ